MCIRDSYKTPQDSDENTAGHRKTPQDTAGQSRKHRRTLQNTAGQSRKHRRTLKERNYVHYVNCSVFRNAAVYKNSTYRSTCGVCYACKLQQSCSFVNMATLVLATQNTSKLIIIRLQTYPKYKMWTTGTDRQENTTGQREHRKTAENTPQDRKWMRVNLHSVTWKLERRSAWCYKTVVGLVHVNNSNCL